MLTISLKTFCVSVFLFNRLIGASAKPIDTRDAEAMVQTPGARLIPKANIHAVPYGARIQHTSTQVQIIGADGTTLHAVALSSSDSPTQHTGTIPALSTSSLSRITRRNFKSGWDAYAYWTNPGPSPISFFTTSWTVPPLPASWDGQLLYIFNGLEPASFEAILQPVLQYGVSPAGGGNYWAVASWYVVGSQAFHSSLTLVSPGQNLDGYMQYTGTSGSTFSWYSLFAVDNSALSASLLNITTTDTFVVAFETLEIYTTSTASDLPTGRTVLNGIRIYTEDFLYPSEISWGTVNDTVDGLTVSVISYSSTNGEVIFNYPT